MFAIAAPVPPYTGYPIDPPFRSRFQARFVDPVGAMMALAQSQATSSTASTVPLYGKLREIILSTQYASESEHSLNAVAKSSIRAFPQTSLAKLAALLTAFPPNGLTPTQLARLVLTIHPTLIYSPFVAWAMLSKQMEEANLGPLGSPSLSKPEDESGYLGYGLARIERATKSSVLLHFVHTTSGKSLSLVAPGGPKALLSYPWADSEGLGFFPTPRFMGLLTCMLQAHVLGWDISYVPPALPSTATCSSSTLVRTFGAVLGYEVDTVHIYKELGGRELMMRRKVETDGSTSWEPRWVP